MKVADGKVTLPPGVAAEELDGGKKKLSDTCPYEVKELLEAKDLVTVYDKMIDAIVKEGNTRTLFGKWKDKEFVSIIDLFSDEFAEKGIKVCFCKYSSASTKHRWLEFIDKDVAANYVSQYDVANLSGQVIKTMYTTLKFPNGVAVEELKAWNGRKLLRDKMPIYVEKLITQHDLMVEYEMLVETCIAHGVGANTKMWNIDKLKEIIQEYKPKFEAKGVSIYISHKQEYVSHGQYGGHNEFFRWIEFVDRELQPNYEPQRDAEVKKEKCSMM